MTRSMRLLATASVLAVAALGATPAFAAGTTAGSTITNTVTLNYQVGGVAQSAVTANTSFTVDRKVNVTVAEVGSATTSVSPGQASAVTAFTVTNNSNEVLDFALAAAQQTGGAGAHSNTDNFDPTNVRVYLDAVGAGAGSYGAEDTQVTYLDELAADASRTIFVVVDIPLGRATGDVAAVTLTATGREGGGAASQGAALTETAGANTNGKDTVFADVAGATDGSRDAAHSAKDDYTVAAASLSVAKINTIISDPLNGTTDPKMIPGATVEYCVQVSNGSGSATATNVSVSDTLPTDTTYDSGFGILVDGTVSGGTCSGGSAAGAYNAGTRTITAPVSDVAAGAARAVRFRVTVN
jgi:uncharacterized repeat protein (TIGR01451 family)